jgi:hypothetical protein
MRLTDTQIKRIKPNIKPYKVSDGGGLFLWVTPSGGKIWRWTYRHEGRAKLMTFGKYPHVPLSLARERHAEARKLLATGTDPMAERAYRRLTTAGGGTGLQGLPVVHVGDGFPSASANVVTNKVAKSKTYFLMGEQLLFFLSNYVILCWNRSGLGRLLW